MIRLLLSLVFLWIAVPSAAETLRIAVTTSFDNSGLSDILRPEIEKELGIELQFIVVGTGQALKLGRAGDVDALLVHAKPAEKAFVAEGFAPYRREIMFNDFIIAGPQNDPSKLRAEKSVTEAFATLARDMPKFVSRGDDSGTHKAERAIWSATGLDPDTFGRWYTEVGAGMGSALNTAAGLNAYVMSDRASWLTFQNKGTLALVFENDPLLFNQYSFLPVDPERHPHVASAAVKELEIWLTSQRAAQLINNYTLSGQRLFTFNASP